MTYVVIGGVAGGAGVAARLRRMDENATIIMVEQGPYISYANCGLPYYAGNVISDRQRLFVTKESTFQDVFDIDTRVNTKAVAIDASKHTVTLENVTTGKKEDIVYDKLVLSPGAKPFVPPIEGKDDKAVFTVRNVPDIDKVVKAVEAGAKTAVVIGGGFIGLEMAENLKTRGLDVSLIEGSPQCMVTLDQDLSALVHQALRNNGIKLHLNSKVEAVIRDGSTVTVKTSRGSISGADMVIMAIGVTPDTQIAKDAGIELAPRGHILVNEKFETSQKDIYAIGDAIAYPSPITGKPQAIALAGPANKMARLCADSIVTGSCERYPGTYGASVAKVFDLSAGSIGLNSRMLKAEGIEFKTAITHARSSASYYPGSQALTAKVLYDPKTGKILGGQLAGGAGVDKHIDVLSTLMSKDGTVEDLAEFEQAYAPPFNSAKDILNMLGFIATNDMKGLDHIIDCSALPSMMENGALVVDVRNPIEFELGAIPGSVNIPHFEIRKRMDEIPKDRDIVLTCAMGLRGHIAGRILLQSGYTRIFNLTGGYRSWSALEEDRKADENWDIEDNPVAMEKNMNKDENNGKLVLDACGLQCPGPIVQLKHKIDTMKTGQVLEVKASDPGFMNDVKSWCSMTGNSLKGLDSANGTITAVIEKGLPQQACEMQSCTKGATIIVFSNSFDKTLASFVLANGAAASGKDVVMFFTFWGLSVLRKHPNKKIKKDFMGKMFGSMLPSDMDHLKLSSMNFAGMGPKMMRSRMTKKNVNQLRQMFAEAKASKVRFIACQMSMDIMGITADELLDGVEIGGVGTYMAEASKSDVNLFI
ncbi:MAG: FAD-dependent oxidoreductase [Candidatus Cloacimonetes bacterium]|nr:FAD-dependent oxidoreductase [Candidatus Cloacimonadota bacterium]